MCLHWPLLAAVGLVAGCIGDIGENESSSPNAPIPTNPTSFECDPLAVPQALPLRRLSSVQYQNTVADLIAVVAPAEAPGIVATLTPLFAQVPDDRRVGPDKHYGGFTRLDQAVHQEHVDVTYVIASQVGAALTSAELLPQVVGECATDADSANDDACLDAFIQRFGERALRSEVSAEDVAFYREVAGAAPFEPADYADVVALLLTAPQMLYFVEHGEGAEDAYVDLSAYELASRLSYHFWQSMPDDELLAAARSGELLTPAGYQAQVERIYTSERTREAVNTFFSEWLENTTLEELDSRVGDPIFDAFSNGFTPGPDLREDMLAEVADAATYYAFQGGTFEDLLTSDKSFARTEDLATIYESPIWDGSSEPPAFGFEGRRGLIARAAFLSTGSANTRPIMKGVFIRKALLCDEIPPPPPNAAASPPQLSESSTTREVVEGLTGSGSCAGCHVGLINPLGFVSENYDSLGRPRTEQTLFDEAGSVVGSAPIDATAVPAVDDSEAAVSSVSELTDLIAASKKPRACFARHYFRFTFGRMEDFELDACALDALTTALDEGQPMAEVLRTVALTDAFKRRSFQEAP